MNTERICQSELYLGILEYSQSYRTNGPSGCNLSLRKVREWINTTFGAETRDRERNCEFVLHVNNVGIEEKDAEEMEGSWESPCVCQENYQQSKGTKRQAKSSARSEEAQVVVMYSVGAKDFG